MKKLLFTLFLFSLPVLADVKISQLPLDSAASTNVNDSFPFVNSVIATTERLLLSDLINLPTMTAKFSLLVPSQVGQNGKCLQSNGSNTLWGTCSTATVTSVGFSDGSSTAIFGVSGSPVTSTGTIVETLVNQSANTVFAGPTSGFSVQPSFRSLIGADLPNPSSSSKGGIQSYAAVSNQWINQISTSGVPSSTQPACGNLSNAAASCSTDTTNAANITSGSLSLTRGGTHADLSSTGGTSQVLKQISSGADITVGQLACSDLSNSVASCSTDATNATNIGSGNLALARLPSAVTWPSSGTVQSVTPANHGVVVSGSGATASIVGPGAAGTVLQGAGASSDPAFSSTPTLGIAGTTLGQLKLAGNTSGTVTIQPGASAGTWSMTLPNSGGSNGQVLTTNGSGVTSWASSTASNITSSGVGPYHVESAYITNNGTCAIGTQSGSWVSSVSHTGTAICVLTLSGSEFSVRPICTCSTNNSAGSQQVRMCSVGSITTTSVTVETRQGGGTSDDIDFGIICMGPQ